MVVSPRPYTLACLNRVLQLCPVLLSEVGRLSGRLATFREFFGRTSEMAEISRVELLEEARIQSLKPA